MKTILTKVITASVAACFAFGALADDPQISKVTVRQRWPWSKLVDIDYVLTADSTQSVGVAVQAFDGDTPLSLSLHSLSGDLYSVQRGTRRIVWDPMVTDYTNNRALTKFTVQLAVTNVATYLIVDMDTGTITPYDCGTNLMTEATNDLYKSSKMLFRRIPVGTYTMGNVTNAVRSREVTISKDFYIGVYEVTRTQWGKIMGVPSVTGTRAVRGPTYYDVREVPGTNAAMSDAVIGTGYDGSSAMSPEWPQSSAVGSASFMGQLRAKTHKTWFDLPTAAQWEYACRAGTTTDYNNGKNAVTNPATGFDMTLGTLAWYNANTPNNASIVGSKLPNAWGLYDMHGDLEEWCLDWYSSVNDPTSGSYSTTAQTDPVGPSSGSTRVLRGGGYASNYANCMSYMIGGQSPNRTYWTYGFRVVLNIQ